MNSKQSITIREVAARAGVSTATVSHVLNGTRTVSAGVAERVREAVNELNYRTNGAARALRSNRSHTIGVVVPDIDNPFYSNLMRSLEMGLKKNNYTITLCCSQNQFDLEREQLDKLRSWHVEAIILAPASPTYDYSILISSCACPVIFIDRKPNATGYNGIFCNMHDIIQKTVEQMIDSGHERIACLLGGMTFSAVQERRDGFVDAFASRGKTLDPRFICSNSASIARGYELMEYALKSLQVTAVLVANRKMAIGALQYLNSHGLRYPEDVAIVGFGAYDWYKACMPELTTIMEPLENMGMVASELLMELIRNPAQPPRIIIMDGYITDRTSY